MADFNITFVPVAADTADRPGQRISSLDPRLSRTHYFDGRLLKASDLTRDQIYLDERAREIGQVLGTGIVRGLEVELVDHTRLRVAPGLAVAPSGRALQLAERTLEVNLGNSGLIASLNQGAVRRFRRGLYLVALQYAEVGSDSAEAYPADLASPRRFRFNSFAEGVELVLVPLTVALAQTSEIAARAGLVPEFIGRDGQHPGPRPELSDEAVALGLLALEQGRPLWLDRGLVRRPLGGPSAPDALQHALASHYDELLDAVLDARAASGLAGAFAAAQYFRLLPPWGRLPKVAVNPVAGSQSFFPAGYEVCIAPVRRDDLPVLLRESASLAPMDLARDADADVMVLAPLPDDVFARRARALERGVNAPRDAFGLGRLPALDRLTLRLHPAAGPHALDTDAATWQALWDAVGDNDLVYVRRPPRAAETNVSAVVLARGFDLPAAGVASDAGAIDPAALAAANLRAETLTRELDAARQSITQLRADLSTAHALSDNLGKALNEAQRDLEALKAAHPASEPITRPPALSLSDLARLRPPADSASQSALDKLDATLANRPEEIPVVAQLLALLDRRYDPLLWPTLVRVAAVAGRLAELRDQLAKNSDASRPAGALVAEMGSQLGLTATLVDSWKRLG